VVNVKDKWLEVNCSLIGFVGLVENQLVIALVNKLNVGSVRRLL